MCAAPPWYGRLAAVELALHAVGDATLADFLVAAHIAEAFLDVAFDLIRGALDLARGFGGIALRTTFGFHLLVAGYPTRTLLDVAFELVHAFTHELCAPPDVKLSRQLGKKRAAAHYVAGPIWRDAGLEVGAWATIRAWSASRAAVAGARSV